MAENAKIEVVPNANIINVAELLGKINLFNF